MNPFNKKLLAGVSALAVLGVSGYAAAQSTPVPTVQSIGTNDAIPDVPNSIPQATNWYATAQQLRNWILGLNSQRGTGVPTFSTNCNSGSNAAITATSTDMAGIVTLATTTLCAIHFKTAYVSTPVCAVTSQTAYGTSTLAYTVTNKNINITQNNAGGEIYNYVCIAQTGG